MAKRNRPADITVLSLLFVLGACVCVACGLGLALPEAEPHPYLMALPTPAIMGSDALSWLGFVGIACVVAALGLWRCTYWGFIAATVFLVLFLAMHFVRALYTHSWLEILVTLATSALAWWYLRKRIHVFGHPDIIGNTPGENRTPRGW